MLKTFCLWSGRKSASVAVTTITINVNGFDLNWIIPDYINPSYPRITFYYFLFLRPLLSGISNYKDVCKAKKSRVSKIQSVFVFCFHVSGRTKIFVCMVSSWIFSSITFINECNNRVCVEHCCFFSMRRLKMFRTWKQ